MASRNDRRGHGSQYTIALITATASILAAAVSAALSPDWVAASLRWRVAYIQVRRAVMYGRVLYFADRAKGGEPFWTRTVGRRGSAARGNVPLFDEGLYVRAYYLRPHTVERMSLNVHSSGIVDVTPIIPLAGDFLTESYDKSDGTHLDYTLDIKGAEYVVVASHYYNGYQYHAKKRRYESDGGMHIEYPTDELLVTFDFTALDYRALVRPEPKLYIVTGTGEGREWIPVPASYQNGVLLSDLIRQPPHKALVLCDWEWSTEGAGGTLAKE